MSASVEPLVFASTSGRVAAVHGSVVDLSFGGAVLPAINEAVAIEWDLGPPLVVEVQQHLGPAMVRAVALGGTAGLRRGTAADLGVNPGPRDPGCALNRPTRSR